MSSARVMSFESELGDSLLFHGMRGIAALGNLPEYEVTLLSPVPDLGLAGLLGKRVAVRHVQPNGHKRSYAGIVVRFRKTGLRGRYTVYQASVRPWLWLLTRRTNCRIFQDCTVREIVTEVLNDPIYEGVSHGEPEWHIDEARHARREYCVQYRESDFAFVSRLLEDEGIYYWFGQEGDDGKFVLTDDAGTHKPVPDYDSLPMSAAGMEPGTERILSWREECGIVTPALVLADYDFKDPGADMRPDARIERTVADELDRLELFDYPGGFDDQFHEGEGGRPRERAVMLAEIRAWEAQEGAYVVSAETNAAGLRTGALIKRDGVRGELLVTRAEFELDYADYEGLERGQTTRFLCRFSARPVQVPYVPPRRTLRPRVQGPQTAVVTGPEGEEIHVDEFGRVKVHFFWDRYSERRGESTSCWIRVSHPWAGREWGMIALPRIGQEVIVDFLEGDPDRPIITGRVYNAEQRVPYALKENRALTGIRTRSTPDGGEQNYNEILFDDSSGKENFSLHAERNMTTSVEYDDALTVGNDRSATIEHHDSLTLKDGNLSHMINGTATYTVTKGVTELYTDHHNVKVTGWRHELVTGRASRKVDGEIVTRGEQGIQLSTGAAPMEFVSGATLAGASAGDMLLKAGGIFGVEAVGPMQAKAAKFAFVSDGDATFHVNNFKRVMKGKSQDVTLGPKSLFDVSTTESMGISLDTKVSMGVSNSTSLSLKIGMDLGLSIVTKAVANLDTDLVSLVKSMIRDQKAPMTCLGGGGGAGGGAAPGPQPPNDLAFVAKLAKINVKLAAQAISMARAAQVDDTIAAKQQAESHALGEDGNWSTGLLFDGAGLGAPQAGGDAGGSDAGSDGGGDAGPAPAAR